jgi:hypothetical protein
MALVYVTVGALMMIWTGVWYVYRHNNPPVGNAEPYWMGGFFITGLTLVVIGLGVGQIGRAARRADPPTETIVAAAPPVVTAPVEEVPVMPAPPAGVPSTPVAVPPTVVQRQPTANAPANTAR